MKRWLFGGILCCFTIIGIVAQESGPNYYQGFGEEVSGKRFTYHSPLPDVTASLLLRGQADFAPIIWKTEVVPVSHDEEFVTFIWIFGRDVSVDAVQFHLSVNGKRWFSFKNAKTSTTGISAIDGELGAQLQFNVTMLDKYKDQMGFAILKLPADAIQLGEPATLKVEAESANNNAWFMTYRAAIEERIDIYQNKVVVKNNGALLHSVSVDFIHLGADAHAEISIGDVAASTTLQAGYNKVEVNLPKVKTETKFTADIKVGDRNYVRLPFTLSPVKEWEVYLVQHTHTDIGYTRPQTEILPEHLRYIDNALDYCDLTDDYPDASQFRWTCETSWSVREFIRSRPKEQVDRLLRRLQEDRIEATGMFFNFSEIIDESALAAQTKTLKMFQNLGIEVNTLMQNDVNGIAWCMVDYSHNTDVKYLTMGVHPHRARLPFDKPTAFWWQSPSGQRLLAYRSEHYQHGNALSLTTGQQDLLRTNLSDYLTELEAKGYPYERVSLQFSGYMTDNSPPSTKVCDIIKEWNEKYEWPKLRSALAKDFMIYLDEDHADEIPAQEVAWPDWWTDGVGSAANETRVAREAHVEIAANTAILSMAKLLGADLPDGIGREIEAVYDDLLFYDEHTHGAAESISDPLAQNTINQWGMKSSYAWEAIIKSSMLQEKALAFIEPRIEKSKNPVIAVFNTLNWERSEMVELFIEHELLPEGEDFTITDNKGIEVPVQVFDRRMEGAYYGLWVENIPPMGYKTLQVNTGVKSGWKPDASFGNFENEYYEMSIEPEVGLISRIYDKELKLEIVDVDDEWGLGQLIYEELSNRHDLERLTNSNRDTVYKALDLKRTKMNNVRIIKIENGAIYKSIFINGEMPVCADERGVDIEIRLFHYEKKIDFLYRMHKLQVHDPEGVYVAFPFSLEDGSLAFEVQGGVVYPGKNQLAGSASDWNTIQNFAAVRGRDAQIVFASKDIPLVQFGDLNIGRYYYRLQPKTNHIYSWVMNNYWVTNFKSSQQGELRWQYSITTSDDKTDMFATRFGRSTRTPILSRVILPQKGVATTQLVARSLIDLDVPNLLLVNASLSMDGTGIVLHVREIEGGHAVIDIGRLVKETGASSAQEISILEDVLTDLIAPLLIEHFETRFLKLNFD